LKLLNDDVLYKRTEPNQRYVGIVIWTNRVIKLDMTSLIMLVKCFYLSNHF